MSQIGGRARHAWVHVGGVCASTLELGRERLTLMIDAAASPWRTAAAHICRRFMIPLFVVAIDNQEADDDANDGWLACYGIDSDGAVLIRPDGHIAWRSRSAVADPEATVANVLDHVLGFTSDDDVDSTEIGADLERRSA